MIFTANNLEKKFKAGGCSAADFVNPIKTAEGQIGSIPDVHERRTIIRIRAPRQTSAMQQQPTRLAGNFCRERPIADIQPTLSMLRCGPSERTFAALANPDVGRKNTARDEVDAGRPHYGQADQCVSSKCAQQTETSRSSESLASASACSFL